MTDKIHQNALRHCKKNFPGSYPRQITDKIYQNAERILTNVLENIPDP